MKNITIDDIFADDGYIYKFKDNYKPRAAQIEAANIIFEAICNNNHAVIEGGTGIGKSFAYLFPILKKIADSGFKNKAVITTSGISLQEQLVLKDLPFASNVMRSIYPDWNNKFKFSLLKGKGNFICLEKAEEMGLTYMSENMISEKYKEAKKLIMTSKTGDLSEMDTVMDKETLESLTCSKKGECKSKECNFYSACYYTKHRKEIDTSNIIITNYHMLFSNIEIGGTILPPHEILVFDEAHESSSIFRDFNARRISINSMLNIRNKISELNNKTNKYKNVLTAEVFKEYLNYFEIAFDKLSLKLGNIKAPKIIDNIEEIPAEIIELNKKLGPFEILIMETLTKLKDIVMANGDNVDAETSENLRIVSTIYESLAYIQEVISSISYKINDKNVVFYAEIINNCMYIGYKEIEVGETLYSSLFNKENLSVIFTSATISVNNNFDYIKSQLGLNSGNKKVMEFIAESPFNLEKQQLWYLPEITCDGNKFGFEKYAIANMLEIAEAANGGTLCLFTSIKSMRSAKESFDRELGYKFKIYAQGDKPKSKLIELFKEDENSILLGTKSFFTGIDVQGNSLRCVVIDKFPFAQPTDPVQQKIMLRDNAFYNYSIPDMIILLKQAVGRGVRGVDDKCVVSILDGRMATARYKVKIFNSFNYKKTSTRNIEDIKKFLK